METNEEFSMDMVNSQYLIEYPLVIGQSLYLDCP